MRNIAAGAEAAKMVVEYQQADGAVKVYGYQMPDGPINTATGSMVRGSHSRCWWASRKREMRGDAVTGRVVAGGPTGYDIHELVLTRDDVEALGLTEEQARERSTVQLSHGLERLRKIAKGIGKGVGDAQVQEAFAADEHGGPYDHQHHHRLDTYQLIAHLEYAHGVADQSLLGSSGGVHDSHMRLHAQQAHNDILARREVDGETADIVRDWRIQHVVEISKENP